MASAPRAASKSASHKKKPTAAPSKPVHKTSAAARPAKPTTPAKLVSSLKNLLGGKKHVPAQAAPAKGKPAPAAAPGKAATTAKPVAAKAPATPAPVKAAKPGTKGGPAAASSKPKGPVTGLAAVQARVAAASAASAAAALAIEAGGEAVCREVACEGLATTGVYCRMHYIKNWKKIKRKEVILKERKLNQYIEELVAKYPDKYIEAIRQDLANDKDFAKVIYDLDLDESVEDFESDAEGDDTVIDSIRRDMDEDSEGF